MKENLLMIWLKDSVSTDMPTALSMWDIGTKTNSMDSEKRSGMTAVNTKDSTKMRRRKDKVSTAGPMAIDSLESGATTCLMAKVFSYGTMTGCS